jgi:predicted kinase
VAAGPEPLVVWINGAFGVGKTAVALELVPLLPAAILFDPERIGSLLREVIPAGEQTDDFQDIAAWREVTRDAVASLARTRPGAVIVPMSVVDIGYLDEIVGGIRRGGVRVVHVSLEAPAVVIARRLKDRSSDESWALERVEACVGALADDRFGVHLDTERESPSRLAVRIARLTEGDT